MLTPKEQEEFINHLLRELKLGEVVTKELVALRLWQVTGVVQFSTKIYPTPLSAGFYMGTRYEWGETPGAGRWDLEY